MSVLKKIGKKLSKTPKKQDLEVKKTVVPGKNEKKMSLPAKEVEKPVVEEKSDIHKKEIEKLKGAVSLIYEPNTDTKKIQKQISEEDLKALRQINERIPLVTIDYQGAQRVLVWAQITWDPSISSLRYILQEPRLSKQEESILLEVKELLQEKLDIDFSKIRIEKAFSYLIERFYKILNELGYKLTEEQKVRMQYYVYRDFMGLGKIEAIMHDENIEDVSCDGIDIPIFIYHRNPQYGQMRTNVVFNSKEELDSFVLKLAQKSGKTLTIAEPLLDGALPDGSRIQATLGTDIARRGSNFTIRKFTKKPMTPINLMNYGTCSAELLAYLWIAIENKLSILVAGSTATGKTSMLNALSLFIKPEMKIVSIEDTPELRLPHPNWIPEVSRAGYGAKRYGEVSMFSLLKTAMRQRPDFVIVGEVRGEEAYVMFQGMATGHAGLGTLHADNLAAIVDRLITKPINLPKAMLENLDIIVFLSSTKKGTKYIRRTSEIVEIVGYDYDSKEMVTNTPFRWNPESDKFDMLKSILLDKIKTKMAYNIDQLRFDLDRRAKLLNWLQKNNITDYEDFAKYISLYYIDPEQVMAMVS